MKRLLLELGGKGAGLVLDDADIKTVVTMIGSVWTFHAGQICTAPTRVIVHRSKYDAPRRGAREDGDRPRRSAIRSTRAPSSAR